MLMEKNEFNYKNIFQKRIQQYFEAKGLVYELVSYKDTPHYQKFTYQLIEIQKYLPSRYEIIQFFGRNTMVRVRYDGWDFYGLKFNQSYDLTPDELASHFSDNKLYFGLDEVNHDFYGNVFLANTMVLGSVKTGKTTFAKEYLFQMNILLEKKQPHFIIYDSRSCYTNFVSFIKNYELCQQSDKLLEAFTRLETTYNERIAKVDNKEYTPIIVVMDELSSLWLARESEVIYMILQRIVPLANKVNIFFMFVTGNSGQTIRKKYIVDSLKYVVCFKLGSMVDSTDWIDSYDAVDFAPRGDVVIKDCKKIALGPRICIPNVNFDK